MFFWNSLPFTRIHFRYIILQKNNVFKKWNRKCSPPENTSVWFFVTPGSVAHQAPLFMGFSSKNTRLGCHFLLQIKNILIIKYILTFICQSKSCSCAEEISTISAKRVFLISSFLLFKHFMIASWWDEFNWFNCWDIYENKNKWLENKWKGLSV